MKLDIDEQLKAYAILKRIPICELDAWEANIRIGLGRLGLRSDRIDTDQYKAIARKQGGI
jgi:hypothetical protein